MDIINGLHCTFQLRCEVKEDWMWDLICKEWENGVDCKRDDKNVIHLVSVVQHKHVQKLQINNTDCLFFTKLHTNYTNARKYFHNETAMDRM